MPVQCLDEIGPARHRQGSFPYGVGVLVGVGVGVGVAGGVVAGVVAGVVCGVVGVVVAAVVGGFDVGFAVGVREGLGEAEVASVVGLVRDGATGDCAALDALVLATPAREGNSPRAPPNMPTVPLGPIEGRSPPSSTGPGLGADEHPAQCVDPRCELGAGAAPSIRGATCELGAGAISEGSTCPTGELPPRAPWTTVIAITLAATIAAAATPTEAIRGRVHTKDGRSAASRWRLSGRPRGVAPSDIESGWMNPAGPDAATIAPTGLAAMDFPSAGDVTSAGIGLPSARRRAYARLSLVAAGDVLRCLGGRLRSLD